MRDKRFISENRGGPLRKEQHQQLIEWGCLCTEHVLHLLGNRIDERLLYALDVARQWKHGNTSIGDARKASVDVIRAASRSLSTTEIAIARSVGHAVATAHMADHALVAAWYALKAMRSAGKSIDEERQWQDDQLVPEIKRFVLTARKIRNI